MEVTVFRVSLEDIAQTDFPMDVPKFERSKCAKKVVLIQEKMSLQDAIKNRLSYVCSIDAWNDTNGATQSAGAVYNYDKTSCSARWSYNREEEEVFLVPELKAFNFDTARDRNGPSCLKIMESSVLGPEEVTPLLNYHLPILQQVRRLGESARHQNHVPVGYNHFTNSLRNTGMMAYDSNVSTYSPGYGTAVEVDYVSSAFERHPTYMTVAPHLSQGAEMVPLNALIAILNNQDAERNDDFRCRSNRVIKNSSTPYETLVVDKLSNKLINKKLGEFIQSLHEDGDTDIWREVVNTICSSHGGYELKPGGTHYNICKAGLYDLMPSLKGTIKSRDDLYNVLHGENIMKVQPGHVFNDKTLAIWLSIIADNGLGVMTRHDGVSGQTIRNLRFMFNAYFAAISEDILNGYLSDVNGKAYVGYGNAADLVKEENAVQICRETVDASAPTQVPVGVFCKPGLHDNYDSGLFRSLSEVYRGVDGYVLSDEELQRSGVMTFSGHYNTTTNRLSISPVMHMVTLAPKHFNTESLDKLRACIKQLLPNATFTGKSMEFSVSVDDLVGDAFRINLAYCQQKKVLEIDSNLKSEEKTGVHSKNAYTYLNRLIAGLFKNSETASFPFFNNTPPVIPSGSNTPYHVNTTTIAELKEHARALGLKISGTKDELTTRLAEKWGQIYEEKGYRERIAEVIPFENLVIFNGSRNDYQPKEDIQRLAKERVTFDYDMLDTARYQVKPSGVIYNIHDNEVNEAATKFAKLAIDFTNDFKMNVSDFPELLTVYVLEHTSSGAIFRKSKLDSLRTPENIFFALLNGANIGVWEGMEL